VECSIYKVWKTIVKFKSKFLATLLILVLLFTQFSVLVPIVLAASSPWTQTDWLGGSGQTNWSDNTQFDSSSSVVTATAGQVTLTSTEELSNTGFEADLTGWDTGAQPDSLTDLTLWLKADAITGLNDGDGVTTWSDQSGQGFNASQTDATRKPIFKTNIINSQPIIRFDGSNDYLDVGTIRSTQGGLDTFVVSQRPSASGTQWQRLVSAWDGSSGDDFQGAGWIISGAWDGSGNPLVYSPDIRTASAASGKEISNLQFGRNSKYASQYFFGDVAEVIVYSTQLSSADNARVKNYLRDKYAVSVTAGITSVTQDTTTTYNGSAGSAKLVTATSDTGEFTQLVNVGDTNSYNLSAYVYTDGLVVTSSDAELFANGNTVTTTYTSAGGGWYQLTGTVTGVASSVQYGVQVKANKTVYLDDLSLNSYSASGSLTSSIFDTEFTAGAAWGTLTYTAITPTNTAVTVKVRTSNSSSMTGATDFSSCTTVTSGDDISSNGCATDSHRYIQYQLNLTSTDLVSTPTFQDISVTFETYDTNAPTLVLTAVSPDPGTDDTPTLTGTATEGTGTVTTVEFQMDATAGSWSSCTADDGSFDEAVETFACTPSTVLSDGSHIMYVRATDSNGNTTGSGSESSDTFTIDTTAPTSINLDSPGNNSYTNNERPSLKWKATSDATAGLSKYVLEIDNPAIGNDQPSGDFTIDDIPVSRTTDYETNKYVIHYENFADSDSTNDYISVYTKSHSDWGSSENDGQLREGKVSWKVKAVDNTGNETSSSRTLFVDRTSPKVELTQINDIPFSTANFSTTDKTPTIYGKIIDSLSGGDSSQTQDENGPKIASGPKQVEITVEKKESLGYKIIILYTINIDEFWYSCDNKEISDNSKQKCDKYLPFEYTSKENLDLGTYRITLTGKDGVENTNQTSLTLNISTLAEIATPEELETIEKELKQLSTEEQGIVEEKLVITKPTEPSTLEKVSTQLAQVAKSIFNSLSNAAQATGKLVSEVLDGVSNGVKYTAQITSKAMVFVENTILRPAQDAAGQILVFVGKAASNTANAVSQKLVFSGGEILQTTQNMVGQGTSIITQRTENWLVSVSRNISNTEKAIDDTSETIGDGYNQLADNASGVTKTILTGIGQGISTTTRSVASTTNTVVNTTGRVAQNTASRISNLSHSVSTTTTTITQGVTVVSNMVKTSATASGKAITQAATLTAKSVLTNATTLAKSAGSAASNTAKAITSATKNGVNSTKKGIADLAFTIGEKTEDVSYEVGTMIIKFGYLFIPEPTRISNVRAVVLSPTSVKITWDTNHPANGKVNWGYEDGIYEFEQQTDKRTSEHEFTLTGLQPDTEYHYEVMSQNRNYVYDANRKFQTPAE